MNRSVQRAKYCLLTGFLLTAGSSLLSNGVYHEDDLQHYLFARWSWHDAHYLLDEWGRPGFTCAYALPAGIGSASVSWHACRLLSVLLTAGTAWLAYRIAQRLRLQHAWLAIPLFYFQPLVTHLSLTTLTETPTAFYIALATWLLLTNRPTASAAVIALVPVTRHETIILLAIWILALWQVRARVLAYPVLGWATVAHNILSAIFLDTIPIRAFFEPNGSSQYGCGTPLSFVPALMVAAGPVVVALAVLGVRRLVKRPCGWLIITIPIAHFMIHTVLYALGSYSSGGYARFLVPTAPLVAVLAVAGAGYLLTHRPVLRQRAIFAVGSLCILFWILCELQWWWRPPQHSSPSHGHAIFAHIAVAAWVICCLWALLRIRSVRVAHSSARTGSALAKGLLAITAMGLVLAGPLWAIIPLQLNQQHRAIQEAAEFLKQPGSSDRPLVTVNCWVYYFSDRWIPQRIQTSQHHASLSQRLSEADPGTFFVWDAKFCPEPDYGLSLAAMRHQGHCREVWASTPQKEDRPPLVVLFEKLPARSANEGLTSSSQPL